MTTSQHKKMKATQKQEVKTQKTKPVQERVLALEKSLTKLAEAYGQLSTNFNSLLGKLDQKNARDAELENRVKISTETVAGIIRTLKDSKDLTEDNISESITLNQEERLKDQVNEMIEKGYLVSSDEITENSFIVSKEFDSKGDLIARRNQFPISRIQESKKSEFLGKKTGESITLAQGNTLEFLEIYEIIDPQEKKEEVVEEVDSSAM